jgi:hypothetical protein
MSFSSGTIGRYAGFWLIITAAIELAIAIVFLVIGLVEPVLEFGFLLTAAILGITGVVLLIIGLRVRASAAANEALLATGLSGSATVTGLTQTGMYLNENPQVAIDMLVDVGGRTPYPVTRKEFVPLILLGRLSSGAPLPVRVDRANPQRVVIDWQQAGLGGAGLGGATLSPDTIANITAQVAAARQAAGQPTPAATETPLPAGLPAGVGLGSAGPLVGEQLAALRAWLRQTGVAGTARIDQVMDMGTFVGSDRLFTVQATLELPGAAPEKLPPVAALVPADDVEKVRVGYRVPVRVAPDNHQLVDFDW